MTALAWNQSRVGRVGAGNVMLEEPHEDSVPTSQKERIIELRQELQKAELADAIEEASTSAVLSVVESAGIDSESRLGPTVFAPVAVSGVTTDTLIDTGSAATILSLKLVLQVLTGERSPKCQHNNGRKLPTRGS